MKFFLLVGLFAYLASSVADFQRENFFTDSSCQNISVIKVEFAFGACAPQNCTAVPSSSLFSTRECVNTVDENLPASFGGFEAFDNRICDSVLSPVYLSKSGECVLRDDGSFMFTECDGITGHQRVCSDSQCQNCSATFTKFSYSCEIVNAGGTSRLGICNVPTPKFLRTNVFSDASCTMLTAIHDSAFNNASGACTPQGCTLASASPPMYTTTQCDISPGSLLPAKFGGVEIFNDSSCAAVNYQNATFTRVGDCVALPGGFFTQVNCNGINAGTQKFCEDSQCSNCTSIAAPTSCSGSTRGVCNVNVFSHYQVYSEASCGHLTGIQEIRYVPFYDFASVTCVDSGCRLSSFGGGIFSTHQCKSTMGVDIPDHFGGFTQFDGIDCDNTKGLFGFYTLLDECVVIGSGFARTSCDQKQSTLLTCRDSACSDCSSFVNNITCASIGTFFSLGGLCNATPATTTGIPIASAAIRSAASVFVLLFTIMLSFV